SRSCGQTVRARDGRRPGHPGGIIVRWPLSDSWSVDLEGFPERNRYRIFAKAVDAVFAVTVVMAVGEASKEGRGDVIVHARLPVIGLFPVTAHLRIDNFRIAAAEHPFRPARELPRIACIEGDDLFIETCGEDITDDVACRCAVGVPALLAAEAEREGLGLGDRVGITADESVRVDEVAVPVKDARVCEGRARARDVDMVT